MEPKKTIDKDGVIKYKVISKLHREDGPAIIYPNGSEEWYFNGIHHRIGGPAITSQDRVIWMQNGYRHREDGPAIEYNDGSYEYFVRDKCHRLDGPAVYTKGTELFTHYVSGKVHRIEGPAIYNEDLSQQHWIVRGKYHRENGPAVINSVIEQYFTEHSNRYDDTRNMAGDVAIEAYFIKGRLHAIDKPAILLKNGIEYWFRNGNPFREDTTKPAVDGKGIIGWNTIWVDSNGKVHNESGPAVIEHNINTNLFYFIHGKRHREDGPASIYYSNNTNKVEKHYYLNGVLQSEQDMLAHKILTFLK